jgi:hypothetical protein
MRILSVDDDRQNLYLIESVARGCGHEVVSASNGVEALAALGKGHFDLIVSDILMPEMDGFRLCHEVKARSELSGIPFVFYTATYTEKKDEELALSLGASRFIVKPLDPERFIAILEEVVREGEAGRLPLAHGALDEGENYLKAYNERLVHKLEDKIKQLSALSWDLTATLEEKNREIAQRREAEEALRRSEEQLRLVWEESMDGMRLTDERGTIIRANPAFAKIFAKSADELKGQPFTCCYAAADAGSILAAWRSQVVARTLDAHAELLLTRWDGKPIWLEWSNAVIESSAGPLILSLYRDVTERRRAEEERANLERQLQQSQKLETVGRLAGGVAHDFNNMLTVVNGYADLLLQRLPEGDAARSQLLQIRKAGDRAASLTQQLLAFSRKQITELKLTDLNAVVTEAGTMLQRLLGEDIRFVTELGSSADCVMADSGQIHQVLMNLAVNARDAMPRGGTLAIETRDIDVAEKDAAAYPELPPGAYTLLTFSDTGLGMDEETQRHMFEPFFTTKPEGTGTGLGLSTAYGIVRQSGGWIFAESKPGQGATFRIFLPRVAGTVPAEVVTADGGTDVRASETILVVEDQEDVRMLAAEVLRDHGYRVLEAASGGAALLQAEQFTEPIHLLLTDVVMPGLSGRELADRLTLLRPGLKHMFMSGYAAGALSGTTATGLATAFIAKPFTPAALAKKVREVLGRRSIHGAILVVDDEEGIQELFRSVLGSAGYEVDGAGNGREALRLARQREFDLVITDLVMPECEGLETIRTLRLEHPDLKVAAMSGAFGGQFLNVAAKLGACASLKKPISPDQLLAIVRDLLN